MTEDGRPHLRRNGPTETGLRWQSVSILGDLSEGIIPKEACGMAPSVKRLTLQAGGPEFCP